MHDKEFNLKASNTFIIILDVLGVMTLGIISYLPTPWWLKLILICLVSAYWYIILLKYGLLSSRNAIKQIRFLTDGKKLITTSEKNYLTDLSGESTVTAWISILCFRLENKRTLSCIVFKDSLPNNHYRQLLVALRLGK